MDFKNTKAFSSFSVKDLDEAKRFYGETLGLGVSESDEGLILQTKGGTDVFIYPKPDHTPATFTVLNFVVDDVDRAVDELNKMGIRFQIYDKGELKTDDRGVFQGKPKIAWFKDPAGNFLSILENNS
ncbi:MAG TPA: VOC family protein [Nitrososphaeraceae archaeon]|jgi:extradiol dioxygenase family protein|nr:VOC family protein [Nitrososphaeraceae archaeon]